MRITFGFIPFPVEIVDENANLSLGEYRLLGYLLRHRFRVKTEVMRMTKDDLLQGVRAPSGERRDKGCGITNFEGLRAAREALKARGWLQVRESHSGTLYELSLTDEDAALQVGARVAAANADGAMGRKASHEGMGRKASQGGKESFPGQEGNLPTYIGSKKVKKVEEEMLVLTADAGQQAHAKKQVADPRHSPCRDLCERYARHKGCAFIWDGSEAKALDLLLKAAPGMTVEIFTQCLLNRAKSEVAHGGRPRVWLGDLAKYQESALDRFGVPKGVSDGSSGQRVAIGSRLSGSGADRRTSGNIDAAQRVYESVVGDASGAS